MVVVVVVVLVDDGGGRGGAAADGDAPPPALLDECPNISHPKEPTPSPTRCAFETRPSNLKQECKSGASQWQTADKVANKPFDRTP